MRGQRAYYVHSLHQRYGPTVRLSPSEIGITTIHDVKTVYHLRETYVKSSFYMNVTVTSEPNMFNTPNVAYNRRLRRLLGGPMSDSSIRSVEPTVVELATLASRRMEEEMSRRGAVDILKWWTFMATDVIGTLTFGESFRTLDQGRVSDIPPFRHYTPHQLTFHALAVNVYPRSCSSRPAGWTQGHVPCPHSTHGLRPHPILEGG